MSAKRSPILALAVEINRIDDLCATLDQQRGAPHTAQWRRIDQEISALLMRVRGLKGALASIPAQTLAEAAIQMRLLAQLIDDDAEDVSEQIELIINSVRDVLEREAGEALSELPRSYCSSREIAAPAPARH